MTQSLSTVEVLDEGGSSAGLDRLDRIRPTVREEANQSIGEWGRLEWTLGLIYAVCYSHYVIAKEIETLYSDSKVDVQYRF